MSASCGAAACPVAATTSSAELLQDLQGVGHEARWLENRASFQVPVDHSGAVLALICANSVDALVG